jgi:putrescine aminotransferase
MPHSALIANGRAFFGRRENDPEFRGMEANPWWLTNTFAGSQPACAAALATIEVYEAEDLLAKSLEKADYFRKGLQRIMDAGSDVLADSRGIGLWIGLECRTAQLGTRLADELFKRDVLVAQTINNPMVLRIQPPLIIERTELDLVLQAIEAGVKATAASPVGAG